jgi:hypothetical protein
LIFGALLCGLSLRPLRALREMIFVFRKDARLQRGRMLMFELKAGSRKARKGVKNRQLVVLGRRSGFWLDVV